MKMRGFTLIEMIATIVIGSIMMLGIAGYVKLGMKGYSDTIDRQRLQTQAQFVLEKMSREIRHAVPNSFYRPEGTNCLEFVPIAYSGFYAVVDQDVQFLLGNAPDLLTMPSKSWLVVNPSRYADLFPDDPNNPDLSQRLEVSNLVRASKTEPFVIEAKGDSLDANSISNRHYIYRDNSQIRYCFDNDSGQVLRNDVIVAANVDASVSEMHYSDPTLQRGGLVHINLEFVQDGERSVYQQDVQVLNVP